MMTVPGFLTAEEADYLVSLSDKQGYGQSSETSGVSLRRTSQSCAARFATRSNGEIIFLREMVPAVDDFLTRLGRIVGLDDRAHLDYAQTIRYSHGCQYVTHHDTDATDARPRPVTMFLYLNDMTAEEGGATHFPDLGISLQPEKGTVSTD